MRVLALDSTTRAGSVVLMHVDGDVCTTDERNGDAARTHAERLPADLMALLDAHALTAAAIDLFAVASGPGSFTGLRIGIATMQGFALATGRPLAGVSALDALAETARRHIDGPSVVGVWMDGHRREIFSALYRCEPSGHERAGSFDEVEPPRVGSARETLDRWIANGWVPALFTGGGAELYAEAIGTALPSARVVAAPALASAVAVLALRRARAGDLPHPAALQPLYVRKPDAELAREKAAERS
jgi:tRNA threonylcarbamoyladenosine biosynthesis protein TsaB